MNRAKARFFYVAPIIAPMLPNKDNKDMKAGQLPSNAPAALTVITISSGVKVITFLEHLPDPIFRRVSIMKNNG
jgi:hypothetical protein